MSKILVVDDDPHIRELVGVFLRAEGFDVCEASDGVEALAKLVALNVRSAGIEGMRIRSRLKTRRADIMIEGSLYTRRKRP